MLGVICAGGEGTRLFPLTACVSKHLLPVFDKPMIFYPLSLCMLAGCDKVVCVVNEKDLENYERLFASINLKNVEILFAIQPSANGILGAVNSAIQKVGSEDLMVVLGDNLMFGSALVENLRTAIATTRDTKFSTIFSVPSSRPEEFGVIKYSKNGKPLDIIEKPTDFISHDVVPGIYFYKSSHLSSLSEVQPSTRGELEITDFNRLLLKSGRLQITFLGRGITWLDCGSFGNLLDAALSIALTQKHSSEKIGDIIEIDSEFGSVG